MAHIRQSRVYIRQSRAYIRQSQPDPDHVERHLVVFVLVVQIAPGREQRLGTYTTVRVYIRQPRAHIRQSSARIRQSRVYIRQSRAHIRQSQPDPDHVERHLVVFVLVVQIAPGREQRLRIYKTVRVYIRQPRAHIRQSRAHIRQSWVYIRQSRAHIRQSQPDPDHVERHLVVFVLVVQIAPGREQRLRFV